MSSAGALRTQGNEAFRQKQYFEAYRLFLDAIQKYPQTAKSELSQAYTQLSATELILEKCPQAILSASKAIEYDKSNYRAYFRRGNAYAESMSWQEAYNDYETACEMQPDEQYIKQRLQQAKNALLELGKWQDKPAAPPSVSPSKQNPAPISRPPVPESPPPKRPPASPAPPKSASTPVVRPQETKSKWDIPYAERLAKDLMNDRRPSIAEFREMIIAAEEMHRRMPNIVSLTIGRKICIVGDTHGQYQDVVGIFDRFGNPSSQNPYLFNGDIVDRGSMGVEILVLLLAWKLADPSCMYFNRGNQYVYFCESNTQ
jgi:serine/threonine-protein phosphatase 5